MNLALIGCGQRGESLGSAAQTLGHTVVVCSDAVPAAAKRAASRFRAKAGGPLDAIAAADATLFANPSLTDVAHALRALHTGSPVYWAAPLALAPQHARRLLDAAKASGSILTPLYAARACPQFGAAAAQVASGSIGAIGFIRVVRQASAGPALHALAGDIDWIAATFARVETVFAQIVRKHAVDTAMLTLTLGDGPIVQCVASISTHGARGEVELCAASGMIQFSDSDPILRLSARSHKSTQTAVVSSPLDPPIEVRRLRLFFDAIDAGRIPAAQLKHEIHVVRVVEAALESARSGRAVKVPR